MSKLAYALVIAFLFALVYGEATAYRTTAIATAVFVAVLVLWLASYWLPPLFFRYTNEMPAPVVLSQLMKRAAMAVACVIAASLLALLISGLWLDLPFAEEM